MDYISWELYARDSVSLTPTPVRFQWQGKTEIGLVPGKIFPIPSSTPQSRSVLSSLHWIINVCTIESLRRDSSIVFPARQPRDPSPHSMSFAWRRCCEHDSPQKWNFGSLRRSHSVTTAMIQPSSSRPQGVRYEWREFENSTRHWKLVSAPQTIGNWTKGGNRVSPILEWP